MVAALDHEGARADQAGHLGVVEGVAQVPLEDFVLHVGHVAVGAADGGVFPDPLVEIGRADREAVARNKRRDAHGGLAAVAQAVKSYTLWIGLWQRFDPVHDLLMLRHDDREERLSERVGLALQGTKAVLKNVKVLRRESDKAALG